MFFRQSPNLFLNPEYTAQLNKADDSLVIWLDFMKFGRVTNVDLNNLVTMLSQAISAKAVGFAVAPSLASERRSGLNAELRTGWGNFRVKLKMFVTVLFSKSQCKDQWP